MFDYAAVDCGFDIDQFFDWFVVSDVARGFEAGNPHFIAGMSGVELASEVYHRVTGKYLQAEATQSLDRSAEYWAGWSLAYYQWYRGVRFEDMLTAGLKPSVVRKSYVLHEADVTKFVEWADGIVLAVRAGDTALSRLRLLRGMTQSQLAQASGVSLRMVQLYEQGRNDIAKASAETVVSLSRALGCNIEDLLSS